MFDRWRKYRDTSIGWDEIHSSRRCLPTPAARQQAIRAEICPPGGSRGAFLRRAACLGGLMT
jgi:hypothetical protein